MFYFYFNFIFSQQFSNRILRPWYDIGIYIFKLSFFGPRFESTFLYKKSVTYPPVLVYFLAADGATMFRLFSD